jgi:hypothetical protein
MLRMDRMRKRFVVDPKNWTLALGEGRLGERGPEW